MHSTDEGKFHPKHLARIAVFAAIHALSIIQIANAMGTKPDDPNIPDYQPYFRPTQINSAPAQIGLTPDIAKQGKYGKDVTIFNLDGVDVDDGQYAGRISPLALNGCVYGMCSSTINPEGSVISGFDVSSADHGAKAVEIFAGKQGVAPLATVFGSMDRWGSAAVNGRVNIVNASVGSVFGSNLDVNYAATKEIVSVASAGNEGQPYFEQYPNTALSQPYRYDFSPDAFRHMIIVGAVDTNNIIQAFSNIPGSTVLTTAENPTPEKYMLITQSESKEIWETYYPTAQLTNCIIRTKTQLCDIKNNIYPTIPTTIPLKNLWLVVPSNATSWAAPQVSGALALLMARWPMLKTNGNATSVLFATAQDLGAPGVDEIYGNGLLRIDRAFQPVGQMTVPFTYNNVSFNMPINMYGAYVRATTPVGSLPLVVEILNTRSNTFDQFGRDFKIDWRPLIMPASSSTAQSTIIPNQTPTVQGVGFADGSYLAFGKMETVGDGVEAPGITTGQSWFASFTEASGTTLSAGQGFPASMSFAGAMYGSDRDLADQSSSLGAVNALASIAQGGGFAAVGTRLGSDTQLAFGWSSTQATNSITGNSWAMPDANSFSAGLTTQVTKGWKAGLTLGMLNEKEGMLGATYASDGPLSFGEDNRSFSVGVSSAVALTNKTSLLLEASMGKTAGSDHLYGLITDTSDITTRSFGASLAHKDAFDRGDRLELSVKAPLKVVSGSAGVMLNNVDEDGNVSIYSQRASLRPDGSELNFGVAYKAPVTESFEWNGSLNYRRNADNIAGNAETVGMMKATLRF